MSQPDGKRVSTEDFFARAAQWTSRQAGRAHTFAVACLLLVIWAVLGPVFGFSDGWQLVINTGTTIVTFLMVFLIQNAQNRDTTAIQLKLDELIRVNKDARNRLLSLEDLSEDELKEMKARFEDLAERQARSAGLSGESGQDREAGFPEGADAAQGTATLPDQRA